MRKAAPTPKPARPVALSDLRKHPDLLSQYNAAKAKAGCCGKNDLDRRFLSLLRARA